MGGVVAVEEEVVMEKVAGDWHLLHTLVHKQGNPLVLLPRSTRVAHSRSVRKERINTSRKREMSNERRQGKQETNVR